MVAVGDVLIHRRIKAAARDHDSRDAQGQSINNGGFDWIWQDVSPYFRDADIAFANLEVPIAPDHNRGVHGERFNSPATVATSLAHSGITVVSTANNHSFDQGPEGLVETHQRLSSAGITSLGSAPSCELAQTHRIVETNGLKIAMLAVTDLMNLNENTGPNTPCTFVTGPVCQTDCGPDRDAIHYAIDETLLEGAIRAADRAADAVVVSFHWGDEYRTQPLDIYRNLAPKLAEAGADVIIGHHPHVLQPVVFHRTSDGRDTLIAYSLGNFVSDMAANYDTSTHTVRRGNTRDGLLLSWTFVATRQPGDQLKVSIEDLQLVPLWTENNKPHQNGGPTQVRVRTHASIRQQLQNAVPDRQRTALRALIDLRWQAIAEIVGAEYLADPPPVSH